MVGRSSYCRCAWAAKDISVSRTVRQAKLNLFMSLGFVYYKVDVISFSETGSCWLKQCQLPKPQITSVLSTPTTFRSGKQADRMSRARSSFLSRYVGTTTAWLAI